MQTQTQRKLSSTKKKKKEQDGVSRDMESRARTINRHSSFGEFFSVQADRLTSKESWRPPRPNYCVLLQKKSQTFAEYIRTCIITYTLTYTRHSSFCKVRFIPYKAARGLLTVKGYAKRQFVRKGWRDNLIYIVDIP